MAISYPCNLPSPLVSQNAITPQAATRMQQVAGGPPIAHLFSSDTWVAYNTAWSFSEIQYQVFTQWFIWKLARGSKSAIVPIKDSLGLTDKECYIPTYSAQQNGRRWIVSTQLIVIRQEKMTECDAESLINSYDGFDDLNKAIILMDSAVKSMFGM